jgi:hypothetical protein
MFPTEYALLQGAGKIISAWLQGTFASIDFCERAHAQFRRDINSPTVGCDFTASSNTLLVRQWLASHISNRFERECIDTASAHVPLGWGIASPSPPAILAAHTREHASPSAPSHLRFANMFASDMPSSCSLFACTGGPIVVGNRQRIGIANQTLKHCVPV